MGVTGGAGTANPSWASEFTLTFSSVCVVQSLVFCVMFYRSLFVPFSYSIVLSVLRPTTSDYLFDILFFFHITDTLENKWKFHYDTVWGGMFLRAIDGDLPFYADYGYPYYNDHHFHLGYFLYAMAYYVRHNPNWGRRKFIVFFSSERKSGCVHTYYLLHCIYHIVQR